MTPQSNYNYLETANDLKYSLMYNISLLGNLYVSITILPVSYMFTNK